MDVHSLEEIRNRLPAYVDRVNEIYARSTIRQFTFDPETGVRVLDSDNSDVDVANCLRSPCHVYTVYLITGSPFGQTGTASCGRRGEDELTSVVYHVSHLPVEGLPAGGTISFQSLVVLMAHELGHNRALIDNYFLVELLDATGVEPDNSIFGLSYDSDNAYWSTRPLTWNDPMGSGGPSAPTLDNYEFSPLDSRIIDRWASLEAGAPRLNNGGGEIWLRDEFEFDVTVVDATTGTPLPECVVDAHFQRITEYEQSNATDRRERLEAHTYETGIVDSSVTNDDGVATVTLDTRSNDHAPLFKAQCPAHEPSGAALTRLDFIAAREFPEAQGVEGGYNARVVLEAAPIASYGTKN